MTSQKRARASSHDQPMTSQCCACVPVLSTWEIPLQHLCRSINEYSVAAVEMKLLHFAEGTDTRLHQGHGLHPYLRHGLILTTSDMAVRRVLQEILPPPGRLLLTRWGYAIKGQIRIINYPEGGSAVGVTYLQAPQLWWTNRLDKIGRNVPYKN